MTSACEGIFLCVLYCVFYWGGVCCVCSPSFSFPSQNLKVPVPDEISLELGRVLLHWLSLSVFLLSEGVPENNLLSVLLYRQKKARTPS